MTVVVNICPLFLSAGGNNGAKFLPQLYVLDIAHNKWACMDDGSNSATPSAQVGLLKPQAVYSTFYGNRLITLKPDPNDSLNEISITEFTLPEDIERTKAAQRDQVRPPSQQMTFYFRCHTA